VTTTTTTDELEDVDAFRLRARAWIKENLPPMEDDITSLLLRRFDSDEEELAEVARNRELQRMLFDAGFAGLCFPKEYGGQGLTPAHQAAWSQEIVGHEFPVKLQIPTFSPCAPIILEFGTHEQKLAHIPAILKGEEIWIQFLSEPSGGSDVAGALTTAVRDGDQWMLSGSKIWTTGAWWSDWGLCLARTNWDVPKHRGLTVFLVKTHQPGIEVHRIEMLNGSKEFCQEFMTDVPIPDSDRVGEVDDGWTVGTRWMFHERMVSSSPFVTWPTGAGVSGSSPGRALVDLAAKVGKADDARVRDLIGEAHTLDVVQDAMLHRVAQGVMTQKMPMQAGAIGRVFGGVVASRMTTIGFDLAGSGAVAWTDDDEAVGERGVEYLMRQAASIGGGTTEMARNVVSERVLGMPRERTLDKDVPFREVPRNAPTQ
jgi:alkylation response protein AidB-like acyl-CoA dehydrogenase